MNMHHPTAAEQARKARELREKFYGKPAVTNRAVVTKAPEPAPDYAEQIARLEALISQAEEVSEVLRARLEAAHREHPIGTLKEKVVAIIAPVLERHGLTFQQLTGKKRSRVHKAARKEAWRDAYEGLPNYSLSELGEVFNVHYSTLSDAARKGGWDHSQRLQTRPRKAGEGVK